MKVEVDRKMEQEQPQSENLKQPSILSCYVLLAVSPVTRATMSGMLLR
jgi:hypothetical protein